MRASSVRVTAHANVGSGNQPDQNNPLGPGPNQGVRERSAESTTHRDPQDRTERPTHRSKRLIAQLNARWRVVDDPLQWRLQRKKGNPRSKNAGWRNRSFCGTREGLLRCVREYCGEIEPAALAKLTALPVLHAMQNLDVPRTDQAHADGRPEPLVSQGLEVREAGDQPSRSSKSSLL